MTNPLHMPGATLVTRLQVYDTPGPDGQLGGTPHFHLVCSEMYYVLSGRGAVEIIDTNGFQRVELPPGSAFIFTAGTLHRLIVPAGGALELLILMQNSGLPERGDTVATFRNEILSDPARFKNAMNAQMLSDAYRRRDAGVEGFLELKEAFARSLDAGRAALNEVYKLARERTAPLHKHWYELVAKGAFGEAQHSLHCILDLTSGRTGHLREAQHHLIEAGECSTVGFCGRLNRYFDPAAKREFLPEGATVHA